MQLVTCIPTMRTAVRRAGVPASDVEDVVQDALERALRGLGSFVGTEDDLLRWSSVIARNVALDRHRRPKYHGTAEYVDQSDERAGPETLTAAREVWRRIEAALPPKVLEAVRLYAAGYLLTEMGVPKGTAGQRIHTARAILREKGLL